MISFCPVFTAGPLKVHKIFKLESSSVNTFLSDLRSGTIQHLSAKLEGLIKFTHYQSPLIVVQLGFFCTTHARTHAHTRTHLLHSSPSSVFLRLSHWLLNSLLKIRLVETSTFCGGGLERNMESSKCIQSPQQVTGGGGSLSFSVSERERGSVSDNPIILSAITCSQAVRTQCAAAISLRSDIPGFSWNCSFPRLLPTPPVFACLWAKLIPSPHPISAHMKDFLCLYFPFLIINCQRYSGRQIFFFFLVNIHSKRNLFSFVPPAGNQKTFPSNEPLRKATEK